MKRLIYYIRYIIQIILSARKIKLVLYFQIYRFRIYINVNFSLVYL